MPREQGRWHGGDIERGQSPPGAPRDVPVGRDGAQQRIADVQPIAITPGTVGADLEVMHGVAQRLRGVSAGRMQPVSDLTGELHRLGAGHRSELERNALLHGPRSGRHTRVTEKLSVKVDRTLIEQLADHAIRLTQPPIGWLPRHSIPYCSSIARFPMPRTTSARPRLNSSSVAAS
jgi:hypothetical protein